MANSFRPYSIDQAYLLPQAPREWLPEGHLAFFRQLDLSPIFEGRRVGRGPKPYHPQMLLTCPEATLGRWDQAIYAFLAEKERHSGSMRTVVAYSDAVPLFW